ncbi:MAG: RHS repeat-associated core domain-containing protein [Clostridia bacterium]|nr:RHS repeat-associated core domain-containing protein [Clostridia bacterium]
MDYDYYYNGSTLAGFKLYVTEGVDTQEYLVNFMYDENGEPFGFTVDGDSYYYVRNAQNDIFLIVDSDNQGVVLYQYDAWGNVTACYDTSEGSILSLVNPYTYRGYYYDIETGYYYLNSRYYSPQLHRFISADGLVSTGQGLLGCNMFAYCGNNPIIHLDSFGTSWQYIKSKIKQVAISVKKFISKTFGSSYSTTAVISETRTDILPSFSPISVSTGTKTTKKITTLGNNSKPITATANKNLNHPIKSSNVGVNINDQHGNSVSIKLGLDNISVFASNSVGNSTTTSGIKINISELKVVYECSTSTVLDDSTTEMIYANAGVNFLPIIAYAFVIDYVPEVSPNYSPQPNPAYGFN